MEAQQTPNFPLGPQSASVLHRTNRPAPEQAAAVSHRLPTPRPLALPEEAAGESRPKQQTVDAVVPMAEPRQSAGSSH